MRWSLALLFSVLVAPLALAQAPAPGEVVVNEIVYDPPSGGSDNEWVEVYNRSDRAVDLAGMAVRDAGATSDPVAGPLVLEPGEYAVLVRNGEAFAASFPDVPFVEVNGFPILNNGGDTAALVLGETVLDAVPYEPSWGGSDASLERIDQDGPSTQPSNFGTTTDPAGGTPGAPNSVFAQDTDAPEIEDAEALDAQSVQVTFSEPVNEASAETAANYSISEGVGAPASAVLQDDPTVVVLQLATPLAGPEAYTLTVSGVADRSGNVLGSGTAAFFFGEGATADPRDLVINEFLYDEPTADNPGEFVELFNRTDQSFDLRDFTLNDATGDDQPVTNEAVFVEPGGYAVVVEDADLFRSVFPDVPFVEQPSWSALNNTGDGIVLKYQGATIDSLFYQPSWGGEDASLERKDPDGPSSVAVNWATTTDVRGGTPDARNTQFAPDLTGPQLIAANTSPDGRTVTVTLDEPVDPATVSAAAFAIEGGPDVTAAAYDGDLTASLTLDAPLAAGTSTVTASGLRDLLGNATAETSTTVVFTPDTGLPSIARASATSATTVRVAFSEPVTAATAGDPTTYAVDGGIGEPASVAVEPADEGGVEASILTLDTPLADRQLYTVTASGLEDLAGNVQPSTSAALFFGEPDVPAPGDLVVTEIMYDPAVGSDGEYIEVLNTTADEVFDLRGVTLDDGDGNGSVLADEPAPVLPGEYVAVVRDGNAFRAAFPEAPFVEAGPVISLSNSGEAVVLRAGDAVLDSVAYEPDWHRVELDDATGSPSNAATRPAPLAARATGRRRSRNVEERPRPRTRWGSRRRPSSARGAWRSRAPSHRRSARPRRSRTRSRPRRRSSGPGSTTAAAGSSASLKTAG